jgi:bacterioferritin-associated ferredoxin
VKLHERRAPARAFVDRLYPPLPVAAFADSDPDTLVCRCEAVTLARIRAAIRDGATGPNRVKTFTRCGMGPCQGRMCGNALTRIVAAETGKSPQEAGALRIRPPLKPTLIADFLGMELPAGAPE